MWYGQRLLLKRVCAIPHWLGCANKCVSIQAHLHFQTSELFVHTYFSWLECTPVTVHPNLHTGSVWNLHVYEAPDNLKDHTPGQTWRTIQTSDLKPENFAPRKTVAVLLKKVYLHIHGLYEGRTFKQQIKEHLITIKLATVCDVLLPKWVANFWTIAVQCNFGHSQCHHLSAERDIPGRTQWWGHRMVWASYRELCEKKNKISSLSLCWYGKKNVLELKPWFPIKNWESDFSAQLTSLWPTLWAATIG